MLFFFLSCHDSNTPQNNVTTYDVPDLHVEALSLIQKQRRFYLDMLGVFPTNQDVETLMLHMEQHPKTSLIDDSWIYNQLQKQQHQERLVPLFTEWLLTRVDAFNVTYRSYNLSENDAFLFRRSIGEEPTRLMAYIGSQDMDFRDILTVNYTIVNDLLLDIWPLEPVDSINGNDEWFPAYYTDNRPAGGVLMTNGLWWRYYTTPHNYSRTRAMALTDLFLCENYLLKPIKFSAPSLLERDALQEVIQTDEACIGCHSTLDPIASALFGFWWFDLYDVTEMTSYHPEREKLGTYYMNQQPAYFGIPIDSPSDLGYLISQDHRFYTCTTKKMMSLLLRREITLSDFNQVVAHKNAFINGKFRLSELISSIVQSEEYFAGSFEEQATDQDIQKIQTRRIFTASQWKSVLYDFTGFLWEIDNIDMLEDDTLGFRTLLGGIDSYQVTKTLSTTNLSRQITLKRLSQAAATHVVNHDFSQSLENRKLLFLENAQGDRDPYWQDLNEVSLDSEPGRNWLHQFSLRVYGQDMSEELEQTYIQFYHDIEQDYGNEIAWRSLISVLIRDPAFWTY